MADVFTTDGAEYVVDLIDANTHYVAMGTGTTGAVVGDAALETESAEARVSTTDTQPSASVIQFQGTIVATGTRAITEAGILTQSTGGILVLRSTFAAINVVADDSIQFTFQLTVS